MVGKRIFELSPIEKKVGKTVSGSLMPFWTFQGHCIKNYGGNPSRIIKNSLNYRPAEEYTCFQ